jgi:hypothetical protein
MVETPGTIPPKYDLGQVYTKAFGHVRLPYPLLLAESRELGISPVGTIKALKGSFKLKSTLNTDYALPTKLDAWQIPQEPIISIIGSKNVIETQLNRGDRTQNVIEEVNLNNYEVRIRGIILNEDQFDEYPEESVSRLREICVKPGSITIDNGLAALCGITKVVIKRFNFQEVQGYLGAQAFELECVSDEDFELELIDEPERL